jgi:hypothetical protein
MTGGPGGEFLPASDDGDEGGASSEIDANMGITGLRVAALAAGAQSGQGAKVLSLLSAAARVI